jgi:release factor glutamine methyltransferase
MTADAQPGDGNAKNERENGKTWTVLELLTWTKQHFAERGIETAQLDAECLLAHVLDVERLKLFLDFEAPVSPADRGVFRELVKKRANERVPVAQLTGHKEFWSLPFKVTADVLVPRPDTETLVAAVLERLPRGEVPLRLLDVGTGSGAVALAIAHERPTAHLVATDISQAALQIARENADVNGVSDRVEWLLGPLFDPVAGQRFDWIVSNPPYVAESQRSTLPPELAHEPEQALFSGEDGTTMLAELIARAPELLLPGGGLAVELAPEQADSVTEWCSVAGLVDVRTHRDLARRVRVVSAVLPAG